MKNYAQIDSQKIWHPFTQMKLEPVSIVIQEGSGTILRDVNGKEYIDAISSWWVNLHGHPHPEIARAISEQAGILDQVIFAGFTHPQAVDFAAERRPPS